MFKSFKIVAHLLSMEEPFFSNRVTEIFLLTISESRLLTFFGGKCFDRFQIEIVIQMQIVQILSMNQ